jgi:tetratricopeptide (TPR) repeat protein
MKQRLIVCTVMALTIGPLYAQTEEAVDERAFPEPVFERMEASALDRSEIDALLYEALNNVLDEDYSLAIPKLERVIEERPTAVPAWEALGWTYWKLGRRDDAMQLWHDLQVLNPDLPQAYNLLGMAATAQDDLEAAIRYYRDSLRLNPDQFQTRLSLARIYRWRGQIDESIEKLDALLNEDPDRTDVRLELARALLQNWRYEEARPHWEIILASSPEHIPYQVALATTLLNIGEREQAIELIRAVLAEEPDHVEALTLLADAQEYGDNPPTAIPTLRQLAHLTEDPEDLHALSTRLVRLYVRLNKLDDKEHALDAAILVAHDMVDADPANTDTRLLLGELYSMNKQFGQAEEHLLYVLENMNPQNQRAHRGLFEVYLGQRDHGKAWEQFEIIAAFNPHDPYLHYRRARYEAGRGRYYEAFEALDELELAGRRGAVAVLLYHAISPSDWNATPSVRRLREQILALQEAGYRFITPDQLQEYFDSLPEPDPKDDTPVERVVMITFDDALRSSMQYGTQVAEELGVPMTQFVITGFTDRGDPYVSTWEELKAYQQTGHWSFQSQLYLAEQRSPINEEGAIGMPLANRLWLPLEQRLETNEEFIARVQADYQRSKELLHQHLDAPGTAVAMAYPLGELGQETYSNMEQAIPVNLGAAAEHFQWGFIQSPFGYAVKGNHSYLQQRHELHRSAEGLEALAHVIENHPVFLAGRMRAEFAALQGKTRLAKRSLKALEEQGYPEPSLERVETYVSERMARRFATPAAAERAEKGTFDFALSDPYLGARTRYFKDNIGRRNWFTSFIGGLNITPRLTLEGYAGAGVLKQNTAQPFEDGEPQPNVNLTVDETHIGLRGSYVFTDTTMLSLEGGQRDFSGDADNQETVFAAEGFFRPFTSLDTYFRYENDVVESARSARDGVTHDMLAGHGILHALDWWDIWLSGVQYDFSDGNDRTHLTLVSQWQVWEPWGLHLGGRYGYVTSDRDELDYWTPYKLHRYYLEALLRKNYLKVYYNIGARFGIGRQSVRPEAQAAFDELVERARRQQFDPGEAPEEDWESILGLFASTRIKFENNWEINGEISYNKLPDYNEWNINGGIKYRF